MRGNTGDVAVITGAASGFGRALADGCAARGMAVGVFDIDGDRAATTAKEIEAAHGVAALSRRVDVADLGEVEEAAAVAGERFGRCDLLWVNVGVQHFGAIETITEDVWRWVLDVNVVGAARTVQAFLPLVRAGGSRARIAFTASANVLAPAARIGAYQASKAALVALADTTRIELADEGIAVSVVYPSGMMTRHLESSAAARPADLGAGDVADDDLQAMLASRPLGEADVVTAEVAAEQALAGVLAGEPHVITHGDLAGPVAQHQAEIDRALSRLGGTPAG